MVYTLSNHNQNVMSGLWKDLPYKLTKKVKENWLDNLFFLVPVVGTYQCAPGASGGGGSAAGGGSLAREGNQTPLARPAGTLPASAGEAADVARGRTPCWRGRPGRRAPQAPGGPARDAFRSPTLNCPGRALCATHALTLRAAARYAVNFKEQEKLHHRY